MPEDSRLRRLLHRWFVEYNPLYLLSAMLVLGGTFLTSRGLAQQGVNGGLSVVGITEIYALALIGGAALLYRIGHRRSAVMLGLLTVLYQADLTLHTEACPNLGSIGVLASMAWLAVFAAKVAGASWALRLRLSRATVATLMLGGGGLTLFPYILHATDRRMAGGLVAVWLFGLTALQRYASIGSHDHDALDDWGRTVLRRSTRAAWLLWGGFLGLHLVFWAHEFHLDLAAVLPALPLVVTRWMRRERGVWIVIAATLAIVALRIPAAFWSMALIASAVLALRGWRASEVREGVAPADIKADAGPYRACSDDHATAAAPRVIEIEVMPTGVVAAQRLFVGAACLLYLAAWTVTWEGGPWPEHLLPLDLLFGVGLVFALWRHRAWIAAPPLGLGFVHALVAAHLVPEPRSLVEWGGAAIGLGFLLLFASLGASYWLRARKT